MGGHGALLCALKNPGLYKAVTAFAPIANPSKGKWGVKAFTGYLGNNQKDWEEWDATHLVHKYNGPPLHIIIEQVLNLFSLIMILIVILKIILI
jgi:S-formylglutathione hydrolase